MVWPGSSNRILVQILLDCRIREAERDVQEQISIIAYEVEYTRNNQDGKRKQILETRLFW